MSETLGVWSTLFLLGAYHGINPGMGWLFAVARGMQEHRARAVAWSLPPIALGHALSIGVVVLIVQLAQVALPMQYIRIGVAVTLVGLGVYKLIRSRHFRWGGMQVGFRELTIWSFLNGVRARRRPDGAAGGAGRASCASSYGRIPGRRQRRLGHADPHAGILHRDCDGGIARLSEIRPGHASPVVVQSGPDLGGRVGSHRFCSARGLNLKAT